MIIVSYYEEQNPSSISEFSSVCSNQNVQEGMVLLTMCITRSAMQFQH